MIQQSPPGIGQLLASAARSVCSLAPAVKGREQLQVEIEDAQRAARRGYFTADEDDRVRSRFSQYLTARAALWQTIGGLEPIVLGGAKVDELDQLRGFVIAYTAACLLVRSARAVVMDLATDSLVQRKLNEAEPRFGIPRRQYTAIYKSLTSPMNAWRLNDAIGFARERRREIESLADDECVGPVLAQLPEVEEALNVPVKRYLLSHLRYRLHSLRRRHASAAQRTMCKLLELGGRVVADIHNPWHNDRVTPEIFREIEAMLEPGDVLITRHDDALSNLFLPGFWPHAALHIGPASARPRLGLRVHPDKERRWVDPVRMLESRKDGVLFRPLEDTLSVDSVAVIRPRISAGDIAAAISRAVEHEGKLYNFDFDFFRTDALACTGVIHRAYDGIGGLRFELKQRAGRLTLSAEDVLDLAVDNRGFEAVAIFGVPQLGDKLITGPDAAQALRASYRGKA